MRREDKGVERDELRVGLFRGEFLSGNAIKFLRLICNMNISIWVFFWEAARIRGAKQLGG
jgi:hypothetical protein